MKEEMLHTWWKLKMLPQEVRLFTTKGESIDIIHFGFVNTNSGPDFSDARIRIGDTLWAGHVEMHINSSDWYAHGHEHDDAYSNVILHVVWKEDQSVFHPNGNLIPCLELKDIIPDSYLTNYYALIKSDLWIPCMNLLPSIAHLKRIGWNDRLMVERLEEKTSIIAERLTLYANDWEEVFYQYLLEAFGLKINSSPFRELAISLPYKLLLKYLSSPLIIEALLLGQAGLLDEKYTEDYPGALLREYNFLAHKHSLSPIREKCKFMRLRPPNFPTIRLAQFSTLIRAEKHLFSRCLEAETIEDIYKIFRKSPDPYWNTHYVFGKPSSFAHKQLGLSTIRLIIINTIVPFFFIYGTKMALNKYINKALRFLEDLPPEKNSIIRKWENLGITVSNAGESQSLLQLKNNYCELKRCLECSLGIEIIKSIK